MDRESRKEAKRAFKEARPVPGVYQIRNTVEGMIFIGSSVNCTAMMNRQKSALLFGSHENARLLADFKRLGETAFSFEILDFIEPDLDPAYDYHDDVAAMESLWLEKLQPYGDKGYNAIPSRNLSSGEASEI